MNRKYLYMFLILTLLINAIIFYFSFEDGETSNTTSQKVEDVVEEVLGEGHKVNIYVFVRKMAHICEFAMLAIVSFSFVIILKRDYHISLFGYHLFYLLAVAVGDEYIQSFRGRTSSVGDVVIDFSGALLGIGLTFLVYYQGIWRDKEIR